MASDSVGVTYHKLHHFLTESTWSDYEINERRLEIMNKCSQTRISRGFSLIVDDSGHRKSGAFVQRLPPGEPRVDVRRKGMRTKTVEILLLELVVNI